MNISKLSFFTLILLILTGSACGGYRIKDSGNGSVDPTQVEFARQRLVAQLATDASPALQASVITQAPISQANEVGSISGTLSYPSELIPAQVIVAFDQVTSDYFKITTIQGQGTYQMDNIPPGTYHIVAYVNGMAAGYSQAVPCGLRVDCTDHTLIDVVVISGNRTGNIDPNDWYAPPGTFPPKP